MTVADPYPAGPAIGTFLGKPGRMGKIEGSFDGASDWPELWPGTRLATAVLGDRSAGPLLLRLRSDSSATVLPTCCLPTETLHAVVSGSCDVGPRRLQEGDLRIQLSGAPASSVVAGPEGVSLITVLGDRRGLTTRTLGAASNTRRFIEALRRSAGELVDALDR